MDDAALLSGTILILLGLAAAIFLTFRPRYQDIHVSRRRPYSHSTETPSVISRVSNAAVAAAERRTGSGAGGMFGSEALSGAGLKLPASEFAVLLVIAAFLAGVAGYILQGMLLGILLALLVPLGAKVLIGIRTGRRRAAFEGQLSDMLMSLSGSLRAGHSIAQSLHSASIEMAAPMAEELARIANADRIGTSASDAMAEVGRRMRCEDFEWLSQAIEINREVGGDLAGVLDHVADTVRERAQIKGQVRALAAEGKFSAYILLALPFFVAAIISVTNPGYIGVMTQHPLGWVFIAVSIIMMAIGSVWISRIIKIEF
jgi:tight adherence protein B